MLHVVSSIEGPGWLDWTPTYTGFSADPSGGSRRYIVVGRVLIIVHQPSNAGTSNATGFTLTLPVPIVSNTGTYQWCRVLNSGTDATTPGLIEVTSSTVLTLYRDGAGLGWTNSGNKNAKFMAIFEVS